MIMQIVDTSCVSNRIAVSAILVRVLQTAGGSGSCSNSCSLMQCHLRSTMGEQSHASAVYRHVDQRLFIALLSKCAPAETHSFHRSNAHCRRATKNLTTRHTPCSTS